MGKVTLILLVIEKQNDSFDSESRGRKDGASEAAYISWMKWVMTAGAAKRLNEEGRGEMKDEHGEGITMKLRFKEKWLDWAANGS